MQFSKFEELQQDFLTNGSKHFSRSEETNQKYQQKREKILKEYCTIEDYIYVRVFKFGTNSQKDKADNIIKLRSFKHNWIVKSRLVYSDFPYILPPDTEHLIFWSLFRNEEDDQRIIKQHMEGYKYFYFKNSLEVQSVKGIKHYHIFCKKVDNQK